MKLIAILALAGIWLALTLGALRARRRLLSETRSLAQQAMALHCDVLAEFDDAVGRLDSLKSRVQERGVDRRGASLEKIHEVVVYTKQHYVTYYDGRKRAPVVVPGELSFVAVASTESASEIERTLKAASTSVAALLPTSGVDQLLASSYTGHESELTH